jgi:hypothetical protein
MKERTEAVRQRMIIKGTVYSTINSSKTTPIDDCISTSYLTKQVVYSDCSMKFSESIEVKSFIENEDDFEDFIVKPIKM